MARAGGAASGSHRRAIGFDERLAHLIEAGADLFLMPSRFEPCGLNQMYSLRYGTVPVVRAVGGLVDTVRNFDPRTGRGHGVQLRRLFGPGAARHAAVGAGDLPGSRRPGGGFSSAGMQQDFSWDASARQYVKVYERATAQPLTGT